MVPGIAVVRVTVIGLISPLYSIENDPQDVLLPEKVNRLLNGLPGSQAGPHDQKACIDVLL